MARQSSQFQIAVDLEIAGLASITIMLSQRRNEMAWECLQKGQHSNPKATPFWRTRNSGLEADQSFAFATYVGTPPLKCLRDKGKESR